MLTTASVGVSCWPTTTVAKPVSKSSQRKVARSVPARTEGTPRTVLGRSPQQYGRRGQPPQLILEMPQVRYPFLVAACLTSERTAALVSDTQGGCPGSNVSPESAF